VGEVMAEEKRGESPATDDSFSSGSGERTGGEGGGGPEGATKNGFGAGCTALRSADVFASVRAVVPVGEAEDAARSVSTPGRESPRYAREVGGTRGGEGGGGGAGGGGGGAEGAIIFCAGCTALRLTDVLASVCAVADGVDGTGGGEEG